MAAVSFQALKLRVIVEADSIRKITLDTRPESVDDLKSILKDKLKLDADFSLQCEDPDFDGELISLVDIDELPQKATLKLFMAEVETSSISTRDTELLSDVSSPEQLSRWLPGQDMASLERQRLEIIQEVQKTEKTLPLIDRMMQTTFVLRRQEVVTNNPPGRDILERWPALRLESQVEDSDEPDVGDAPVAILTVVSDDTEKPIHFNPIKISIVLYGILLSSAKSCQISRVPRA
ncbi:UNVERIFIED_CONTAM: hypothetical protein FKN15_066344 [Acipenser sinensis]